MNMKLIFAIIFSSICIFCKAQTIQLEISGIKNNKGQFLIGVYTNEDNYAKKEPIIWKSISKEKVLNGRLETKLDGLHNNVYGIALMDDEDSNWKMNFTFFIPNEGFAFSNYYHSGILEPKFDDFKFEMTKKPNQKVCFKMRYI